MIKPGFARDLEVAIVPILEDNYAYIVRDREADLAAVVDPGDAAPVLAKLAELKISPREIWLTHRHQDHIGGALAVARAHDALIRGPQEIPRYEARTSVLADGDSFPFGGRSVGIRAVPGHTRGHIVYHVGRCLFSGDVLFQSGCGRIFEGTPREFYRALTALFDSLPGDTLVYPGHEYAERNLPFALSVDPENPDLPGAIGKMRLLRDKGEPTVPMLLAEERKVNPFLRIKNPSIVAALKARMPDVPASPEEFFALLRRMRDDYR